MLFFGVKFVVPGFSSDCDEEPDIIIDKFTECKDLKSKAMHSRLLLIINNLLAVPKYFSLVFF